jgi:hypothetical protein
MPSNYARASCMVAAHVHVRLSCTYIRPGCVSTYTTVVCLYTLLLCVYIQHCCVSIYNTVVCIYTTLLCVYIQRGRAGCFCVT